MIPNQTWPSQVAQPPASFPKAVDAAVLTGVQRVRALLQLPPVKGDERRGLLDLQREELRVWMQSIDSSAWISYEAVAQIVSAISRPDTSPEARASVIARVEGAVAGTVRPAFPGLTEDDVQQLERLPFLEGRAIKARIKNNRKGRAPNEQAIKEAIADSLGGYVDKPFEDAAAYFNRAWILNKSYKDGTFRQADPGGAQAQISFATKQIAIGNVSALTHLYSWH